MKMTIVLTVSDWESATRGSKRKQKPCLARFWSGPARRGGKSNTAAEVRATQPAAWPFNLWTWQVWSPFDDHSLIGGEAHSEAEAKSDADSALETLILNAEASR